jgi:zona occludens toxin
MAISAYVGLPGHGKSYGVVENIIVPALEKKRLIFTNIPMVEAEVFKRFGINVIQFDVDDIKNDANWWKDTFIAGSMFVLDEVPKLWPAGMKATNIRQIDRDFLAEHRHMVGDEGFSTEIILVVQNLTMIAAFPRGLIETTFWVVKHIKMGSKNRYRVDIYSGVMSGQSPQLAKREREIQGKFKPEIFALYSSHTKSKTGLAGNETRIDERFNMFKGASIKIGFVLIVLAAIFVYFGAQDVVDMYAPDTLADSEIIQSETDDTNEKVKIIKVKKGLLHKVDEITFSHSLKSRSNGVISRDFYFDISIGRTRSLITDSSLRLLGYSINQISECLFHVTNEDFDQFVLCNMPDREGGFFANLTGDNN